MELYLLQIGVRYLFTNHADTTDLRWRKFDYQQDNAEHCEAQRARSRATGARVNSLREPRVLTKSYRDVVRSVWPAWEGHAIEHRSRAPGPDTRATDFTTILQYVSLNHNRFTTRDETVSMWVFGSPASSSKTWAWSEFSSRLRLCDSGCDQGNCMSQSMPSQRVRLTAS